MSSQVNTSKDKSFIYVKKMLHQGQINVKYDPLLPLIKSETLYDP
jgi:hypothetical protein